LYKEIGRYDRARLEAMEVFHIQPENPETIEFIRALINIRPGDINLHYALADIYKTLGDKEKERQELLIIRTYYLQLVNLYPNEFTYRLNLSYVYRELDELQKGFDEAIIALKIDSDRFKEVEEFIKLIPPQYLKKYEDYVRSDPSLFFKLYGKKP
jgi:tetratricopeptide (TPR) repeat protein